MDFNTELSNLISQIPEGRVSTHSELAKALGDIRAVRAIGQSVNSLSRSLPLHRVVRNDGSVEQNKADLLREEGVKFSENRIPNLNEILFKDFQSSFPLRRLREEQLELCKRLNINDDFSELESIAGVDVADVKDCLIAVCTVFDYKSKRMIETSHARIEPTIPYIPTYLSFREFPAIKGAVEELSNLPSILMVDGNGILHPLRMGIASYTGINLDLPTIGVAKSLLCGEVKDLEANVSEICFKGEVRGYAFKSSERLKRFVYISPGHRVSIATSLAVVREFSFYKIPEPIRSAHSLAERIKKSL